MDSSLSIVKSRHHRTTPERAAVMVVNSNQSFDRRLVESNPSIQFQTESGTLLPNVRRRLPSLEQVVDRSLAAKFVSSTPKQHGKSKALNEFGTDNQFKVNYRPTSLIASTGSHLIDAGAQPGKPKDLPVNVTGCYATLIICVTVSEFSEDLKRHLRLLERSLHVLESCHKDVCMSFQISNF